MAISAQGETIVPVGRNGEALRPAIVWLDNRAQAEAGELAAAFDPELFYEVTGQPKMLATWPAAKLLWLQRHEPEVARATYKYLLIEDYLLARLTGEFVTEGSLATSTCYWDFRRKTWWVPMLDAIGITVEHLPAIVEPGTRVGTIRRAAAADLGLPATLSVCTGALDQACAAIGAGNIAAGGFSESTGAAIALCATTAAPLLDPRREIPCHYHGVADSYMLHTFTSGGIVLRWFRDAFCELEVQEAGRTGRDSYDLLGELAASVPAGADGLLMLPHLQGAMAPENNDAASGVLLGLTIKHTRAHAVRAIMESIGFIVRRNVEAMAGIGGAITSVRALGGGARSAIWKQIEADIVGLPVVTMRQPDAGALGAAILAGMGIGCWSSLSEATAATVFEDRIFEPAEQRRTRYDDLYTVYRDSYSALVPSFDRLMAVRS
jgi:xylulokinase